MRSGQEENHIDLGGIIRKLNQFFVSKPNNYTCQSIRISPGLTFDIILDFSIISHGTAIIFGYFNTGDTHSAVPRYFWKSSSTGVWRAGIGVVPYTPQNPWIFNKSSNPAGYVHETQLPSVLQTQLDKAYAQRHSEYDWPHILTSLHSGSPEIFSLFSEELPDTYRRLGTRWEPSGLITEPNELSYTQKSATDLFCGDLSYFEAIRDNHSLWEKLLPCLAHHDPRRDYAFHSSLLNCLVQVQTHFLQAPNGTVYIEFAWSDQVPDCLIAERCDFLPTVAWIKAVYMGNAITSFGNFAVLPEDLSFLVQKPAEYHFQTKGAENPTRINQNYVSLNRHNEKYNLLLRAFKEMNFRQPRELRRELHSHSGLQARAPLNYNAPSALLQPPQVQRPPMVHAAQPPLDQNNKIPANARRLPGYE